MFLQRILEPKPDSPALEADLYHSMNLDDVNRQFVDDLIQGGQVGPRVMDLGCGPAGIAIELCQRMTSIEMLATDVEVEMLEIAKREIDIAGMLGRITLHHADIADMGDYEDAMADTVICNTVLHHLENPEVAIVTAKRLLRAGGRLFVRDLVRPESEAEIESIVREHAEGESEDTKQLLRQSLFAALTLNEIQEILGGFGISPQHVQMTSDRHWTIDWCKPE